MNALDRAFAAAALGWHVFPCGADKRPLTTHGLKDASTDPEQIATWWGEHPEALPAVVAGPSGLAIADIDVKGAKDGHAALERLGHPLPGTWRQRTPSGGSHAFYAAPTGVTLPNGGADLFEKGSGIDRRTGQSYAVLYEAPPKSLGELAPAPEWLIASSERPAVRNHGRGASVADFRERLVTGKPSKAVKKASGRFRAKGMSHDDLLDAITRLVRLGHAGQPGVRTALDATRKTYAAAWGADYLTPVRTPPGDLRAL
jgi:hypothetical protein